MKTPLMRMALTLALAAFAPRAWAQNPPPTPPAGQAAKPTIPRYRFRLLGVYDGQTFAPVESAEVADVLNGNKSLTSSTGTVSLFFLPDNGGFVRIRKVGYEPISMLVAISPADTVPVTVILNRVSGLPSLPTVVATTDSTPQHVSPTLRGFEDRRKTGQGHYVTEADLRKRDDEPLGNVLVALVPGVALKNIGTRAYASTVRGGSGTCYPDVYLDGVRLAPARDPQARTVTAVDLSQFAVNSLGAIEFYTTATAPPEYAGTGSGCGVFLLWTREK